MDYNPSLPKMICECEICGWKDVVLGTLSKEDNEENFLKKHKQESPKCPNLDFTLTGVGWCRLQDEEAFKEKTKGPTKKEFM